MTLFRRQNLKAHTILCPKTSLSSTNFIVFLNLLSSTKFFIVTLWIYAGLCRHLMGLYAKSLVAPRVLWLSKNHLVGFWLLTRLLNTDGKRNKQEPTVNIKQTQSISTRGKVKGTSN